jgi:hypothetical protein
MLPKDVIATCLGTLLGFVLAMAWDTWKHHRDRSAKDKAILDALRLEIESNLQILERNYALVQKELEIVDTRSLVRPLVPLHESMWQILSITMPNKIIKTPNLLNVVRIAYHQIRDVSEIVSSRESYRLSNESMSNFGGRMRYYDQSLQAHMSDAIQNLRTILLYI